MTNIGYIPSDRSIIVYIKTSTRHFIAQVTCHVIRMKVAVFFAAICIFALVMPQAYAEEDESAVRETRGAKGVCLHVYIILRNCLPKLFEIGLIVNNIYPM